LINSAARRTLVGTRFRRIAPPEEGAEVSLTTLAGLNADEASVPEAHGDGSGFSGEIIDAEEERVDTAPEFRPPITGILRISSEEGFRNSDGRRCRGGLYMSVSNVTFHRVCEGLDSIEVPIDQFAYLEIGIAPIEDLSLSLRGLGASFDFPSKLPLLEEPDAFEPASQLPPNPNPRIFGLSLDESCGDPVLPLDERC
jgi:hypothetical protein